MICLIQNYLTNIFKTMRHIEQNKEKNFPATSVQVSVLQYIMGKDQSHPT